MVAWFIPFTVKFARGSYSFDMTELVDLSSLKSEERKAEEETSCTVQGEVIVEAKLKLAEGETCLEVDSDETPILKEDAVEGGARVQMEIVKSSIGVEASLD